MLSPLTNSYGAAAYQPTTPSRRCTIHGASTATRVSAASRLMFGGPSTSTLPPASTLTCV